LASQTTYKLYISPVANQAGVAFPIVAATAASSKALYLKVGSNVHGLLRPDKIVLYFGEFPDLQETASQLLERLGTCPAHGVPFSAELGGAGLLSWGVDPPSGQHNVRWLERESWRLRICNRLAAALLLAKASSACGSSATGFAMDRLRAEGIDTNSWTPTRSLSWSAANS
jgi:hypothetical protein